eukprot:scaffold5143_cov119-Isochrysis_galbana.AAC.25
MRRQNSHARACRAAEGRWLRGGPSRTAGVASGKLVAGPCADTCASRTSFRRCFSRLRFSFRSSSCSNLFSRFRSPLLKVSPRLARSARSFACAARCAARPATRSAFSDEPAASAVARSTDWVPVSPGGMSMSTSAHESRPPTQSRMRGGGQPCAPLRAASSGRQKY